MGSYMCSGTRGHGRRVAKQHDTVVKNWNGLPREVVDAPSLGTFKARLDRALSNLVWVEMSLLTAGGLG